MNKLLDAAGFKYRGYKVYLKSGKTVRVRSRRMTIIDNRMVFWEAESWSISDGTNLQGEKQASCIEWVEHCAFDIESVEGYT